MQNDCWECECVQDIDNQPGRYNGNNPQLTWRSKIQWIQECWKLHERQDLRKEDNSKWMCLIDGW